MAKTETYDTSQTKDSETEILTWSFTANLEILHKSLWLSQNLVFSTNCVNLCEVKACLSEITGEEEN